MAAGHGDNVDTALAYGTPSISARWISDPYPTRIGGTHKHDSPREDFGAMGLERAKALDLGNSPLDFTFWQSREQFSLNAGGNIRIGFAEVHVRDDPKMHRHLT